MSREIKDLVPVVQSLALQLIEECRKVGIIIKIIFTRRTQDEQDALYAQGRESYERICRLREKAGLPPISEQEAKRIVTWTRNSMHLFGVAFDIVIIGKDGKATWDEALDGNDNLMADYDEVGRIAIGLKLTWGVVKNGKRTDKGHYEYTGGLSIQDLRAGKIPTAIIEAAGPLSNDTITGL